MSLYTMKVRVGVELSLHLFRTLTPGGRECFRFTTRPLYPRRNLSLPTEQEDLCTSESLWAHGRRDKSHAFAEVRTTIPLLSSSQHTHLVHFILFSYLLNVALFCQKPMPYQHHVPSRHMSRNQYIHTDIVLTSHFTVHKSVHGYYSITTVSSTLQ